MMLLAELLLVSPMASSDGTEADGTESPKMVNGLRSSSKLVQALSSTESTPMPRKPMMMMTRRQPS